jgi:hypothetical protein
MKEKGFSDGNLNLSRIGGISGCACGRDAVCLHAGESRVYGGPCDD